MKQNTNNLDKNNLAFVDGQNLYMGTNTGENPWNVNLKKFRIFLRDKYNIEKAYYFLGYINESYQGLYSEIQESGFVLIFKQHNTTMLGKKKGNVDSDIIFNIMKRLYKKEPFNKIVLVSGDGDYKMLVDFLIEEKRFKKILFPNKQFASSLYKKITRANYRYLEDFKDKIAK